MGVIDMNIKQKLISGSMAVMMLGGMVVTPTFAGYSNQYSGGYNCMRYSNQYGGYHRMRYPNYNYNYRHFNGNKGRYERHFRTHHFRNYKMYYEMMSFYRYNNGGY